MMSALVMTMSQMSATILNKVTLNPVLVKIKLLCLEAQRTIIHQLRLQMQDRILTWKIKWRTSIISQSCTYQLRDKCHWFQLLTLFLIQEKSLIFLINSTPIWTTNPTLTPQQRESTRTHSPILTSRRKPRQLRDKIIKFLPRKKMKTRITIPNEAGIRLRAVSNRCQRNNHNS